MPICKGNQIRKPNATCEECPAGLSPIDRGTKCGKVDLPKPNPAPQSCPPFQRFVSGRCVEPKCPERHILKADGKCEDCGNGRMADPTQRMCGRMRIAYIDHQCKDDEIKTDKGCEKCPVGTKRSFDGKRCE